MRTRETFVERFDRESPWSAQDVASIAHDAWRRAGMALAGGDWPEWDMLPPAEQASWQRVATLAITWLEAGVEQTVARLGAAVRQAFYGSTVSLPPIEPDEQVLWEAAARQAAWLLSDAEAGDVDRQRERVSEWAKNRYAFLTRRK